MLRLQADLLISNKIVFGIGTVSETFLFNAMNQEKTFQVTYNS